MQSLALFGLLAFLIITGMMIWTSYITEMDSDVSIDAAGHRKFGFLTPQNIKGLP